MRLPNGADLVECAHAAWRLGMVVVPFDPRASEREFEAQKARAKPNLILTDGALFSGGGNVPTDWRTPWRAAAAIVFTSGSTGTPRGVVLTHENFLANAAGSAARLGVRPGDAWLAPLPLFHVGGLAVLYRSVLTGIPVVLPGRFDAGAANAALDAGEATIVSLVPTMLRRMLDARGDRPFPPSLRAVLLGGAPAPAALLARARSARAPVCATYGLTEACSQVATTPPSLAGAKPGSVGPPLPGVRVLVDAPDARGVGEILVRGRIVMRGYLEDADATSDALRDGWLRTGDLGRVDADGDLWIVGRRSERILTGGENVDPAEVEGVLEEHPHVAEACVVGVPDDEWGERVVAAVVPAPGTRVDVDELARRARRSLSAYKVPRRIVALDDLPRTGSGKVARDEVRARLAQETVPT